MSLKWMAAQPLYLWMSRLLSKHFENCPCQQAASYRLQTWLPLHLSLATYLVLWAKKLCVTIAYLLSKRLKGTLVWMSWSHTKTGVVYSIQQSSSSVLHALKRYVDIMLSDRKSLRKPLEECMKHSVTVVTNLPVLQCNQCDESHRSFVELICKKFMKPLNFNHALVITDRNAVAKFYQRKPLSRKVLKRWIICMKVMRLSSLCFFLWMQMRSINSAFSTSRYVCFEFSAHVYESDAPVFFLLLWMVFKFLPYNSTCFFWVQCSIFICLECAQFWMVSCSLWFNCINSSY